MRVYGIVILTSREKAICRKLFITLLVLCFSFVSLTPAHASISAVTASAVTGAGAGALGIMAFLPPVAPVVVVGAAVVGGIGGVVAWWEVKSGKEKSQIEEIIPGIKIDEKIYRDHILDRHGPDSQIKGKAKFRPGFNIKKEIGETIKNPDVVKPNTDGRPGKIFEKGYGQPIGYDPDGKPVSRMKVVVDEKGFVSTSYPIK